MKKIIAILLLLVMTVGLACGCETTKKDDGEFNILCSVFPVYDWVCNITKGAEHVSVELLVDSGIDMHNYQATAKDVMKISDCDMFIYVGGVSDTWVEDAVAQIDDKSKLVNLMKLVDKNDLIKVGTESHKHEHAGKTDYTEYDEHIWLSVKNAEFLCKKISDRLGIYDNENKSVFEKNYAEYSQKLTELDGKFDELKKSSPKEGLIICGRQPFKYLCRDYGLDCYAAFDGCSAETEASFDTVISLAKKADEFGAKSVGIIKGDTEDLAKTIISNTTEKNQQILVLDSMQTQSIADIEAGASYIGIMEENLAVIEKLLEG